MDNVQLSTICLLWIFAVITGVDGITRPTNIVLENNGYKNILVGIHPSVPEDPNLITNIKNMFINGSSYLYEATEKRAYFKEVTILIPATWSMNAQGGTATSQIYDNADVELTTSTLIGGGHTRRTRSYSGCGSPGIRIHLTPELFNLNRSKVYQIDKLGPRGRLLVHEWAQFRWGVYDEYAKDGEQQFYYSPKTGQLEGVACNRNMKGIRYRIEDGNVVFCRNVDAATGRYDNGCLFLPYNRGHYSTIVSASIMHRVYVPGIKYFCNSDTADAKREHNYEAPNKQNRLCGQRSTWSVIMDSEDFKNNKNPPRDITDTKPQFKIVKASKTRRVVLALDTSGSMMNDEASNRLRQATADFIHNGISDDTEIGIVSFNHRAKIVHPLTKIKSTEDRDRVKRSLPRKTGGATSFGTGIQKAMELLSKNGLNASGAEIIILSDGKETSHPKLHDVVSTIHSSGALVSVLAFNQETDESIPSTVHSSGGRFYFDNNQAESTTFSDALFKMRRDSTLNINDSSILLMSKSDILWTGKELSGEVYIDEDIGRNTIFTIMYTTIEPLVTIRSPSDRVYNHIYPEYKADVLFKTIRIEIPEIAEVGKWTYHTKVQERRPQKISITVTSKPVDNQREPITIDAGLSTLSVTSSSSVIIWAEVNKGSHPVLGIDVTAVIDRPYAKSTKLTLKDNGAGADIEKDDGVYSRYFTQFSGYGRYSVKTIVQDHNGEVVIKKTQLKYLKTPLIDMESGIFVDKQKVSKLVTLKMSVSRTTTAGNFLYKAANTTQAPLTINEEKSDMMPPVRITDLTVMKTSHADTTVTLSWTAPGDDLDSDTAFKYEIAIANNAEDMLREEKSARKISQEDVVYGNLMAPQESGNPEIYVLKIPLESETNASYVISVKAIDENGNSAEKSNYVTIGFGYVPDFTHPGYVPVKKQVTEAPFVPTEADYNALVGVVGSLAAAILFTIVLSLLLHRFSGNNPNILHNHYRKANVV